MDDVVDRLDRGPRASADDDEPMNKTVCRGRWKSEFN